jgi:hypothetical protein
MGPDESGQIPVSFATVLIGLQLQPILMETFRLSFAEYT